MRAIDDVACSQPGCDDCGQPDLPAPRSKEGGLIDSEWRKHPRAVLLERIDDFAPLVHPTGERDENEPQRETTAGHGARLPEALGFDRLAARSTAKRRSVQASIALLDSTGEEPQPLEPVSLKDLRFGVAQGRPLDGLDGNVAERFGQALTMLGRAGCQLHDEKIALLDELPRIKREGIAAQRRGVCDS
jgi:hypothetical protein